LDSGLAIVEFSGQTWQSVSSNYAITFLTNLPLEVVLQVHLNSRFLCFRLLKC